MNLNIAVLAAAPFRMPPGAMPPPPRYATAAQKIRRASKKVKKPLHDIHAWVCTPLAYMHTDHPNEAHFGLRPFIPLPIETAFESVPGVLSLSVLFRQAVDRICQSLFTVVTQRRHCPGGRRTCLVS
ncbi:hypothetical protein TNCV_3585721 [Trichonephila clavipes]|nr:hypothetical protein TNCV_3585721 [Trichonephila clavipes]